MTAGIATVALANAILDHFRGGTTWTAPAGRFVQLHTADPGSAGTTSISVGSTTRQSVSYNAASSGAIALTASPTAWTNGGTSETITHVSVWSASTSGTFLYSVALSSSQAWASTNTFTLTTLGWSFTPLAA